MSTSPLLRELLHVREAAVDGARRYFQQSGLTEVAVPVLVGITGACENVSTLFRLSGDVPVHLSQTGQLALEHALCVTNGVFCQTSSFRTDKIDVRHLSEFTLFEEEICCDHPAIGMSVEDYKSQQMFDALLERVTGAIKAMIANAMDKAQDDVAKLGGDLPYLTEMLTHDFYRISYTDAIEIVSELGTQRIAWGEDLGPEAEHQLLALIARESGGGPRPTFITHYPENIKFFNMKIDDNNTDVVQSADLLLPGVGESVGSAVREYRHDVLLDRLINSVMFKHITEQKLATLEDFGPYLEVIRERRVPPHAGYGIGLERVIQFIAGSDDIRSASVQYRLSDLLGFSSALSEAQPGSTGAGF
jgi:asparaginyl-tRNA synthetase